MPTTDHRLARVDDHWLALPARHGVPAEVCAGPGVPVEAAAIDEALAVLDVAATVERLATEAPGFLAPGAGITRMALMPDVHKGAGIPIGTVLETSGLLLPQAVGNDVNCGVRLEVTSVTAEQLRPRLDAVAARLRQLCFEGGRQLPLAAGQRAALLRAGLPGLLGDERPAGGLWRHLGPDEAEQAATRVHGGGGWPVATIAGFEDWVGSAGGVSYDSVIGSIGGGNHFAEVQYVAAVRDPHAAWDWGRGALRPGQVVTMVHSGSLGLGHQANLAGLELLRSLWPRGVAHPANGLFPLPLGERGAGARRRYLELLRNAANFALGNRLCLALILREALTAAVGELAARLVHDAPHNLLWLDGERVVHRKGATPAGGPGPDRPFGEPVLVPGSMGAPSYLLRGLGNQRTLASACHGAGRQVARGALSARGAGARLDEFLREFRVVTPLDPRDPRLARRADVLAAWRRDLVQEAPWAYKDVGPVVATLEGAGVAAVVAELRPLLTVKA